MSLRDTNSGFVQSRAPLQLSLPSVLRAAITLCFVFLAVLAWVRNVNWDEFFYLSQVHAYLDGRLDRPLQTFHVHLFGWLAQLPGDEMTQIAVARLVMTVLLGVSAFSIWHIARRLVGAGQPGKTAASLAVLGFLTSGYVLAHGTSFRTDPIASALLMAALAVLMTSRMAALHVLVVALLGALAMLVTIKSVLYFPAILAVLLWRADERGVPARIIIAGLLAAGIAVSLYVWHAAGLQVTSDKDAASTTQNALKPHCGRPVWPRACERPCCGSCLVWPLWPWP